MGFFFRKSLGFGPLRLNFSKSGVGASIGVKGARLTASSRGSTYITVGSHGFYYRQAVAGRPGSGHGSGPSPSPVEQPEPTQRPAEPGTIPTANISELLDSSNADLVKQLNERAKEFNPAILAWISCIAPFVIAASSEQVWWSALVVIPIALGYVLQKRYRNRTTTRLFYELSAAESANLALLQQAIVHLSHSNRIWRIVQEVATDRQKYHAGASSLIKRTPVRAGILQIPRVTTNLSVVGIDVGAIKLFLLPDMILYLQGNAFANIPYETFSVRQGTTRFIEDDSVPGDALIVGQTWRYVNKNGGPDRRFNSNRQLPIAQYGVLELVSSGGLNIHLNTSSAEKAAAFANCMAERLSRNRTGHTAAPPLPLPSDIGPRANALKALGLSGSPSAEELSAAYRHLARMYHPDKVAGLAPEFQELAERRMKEINAAYALLGG
jgi:hypothetical protein